MLSSLLSQRCWCLLLWSFVWLCRCLCAVLDFRYGERVVFRVVHQGVRDALLVDQCKLRSHEEKHMHGVSQSRHPLRRVVMSYLCLHTLV
jgi:hypothetical protein